MNNRHLRRITRYFLLILLIVALVIPASGPVRAQAGTQTITLDMIPVGIKGEVKGSIAFQLPSGYELYKARPGEGPWGEETVSWTDYDYHGTRVVQTVTFPSGSQDQRTGDEIDGIGFGGGVLYVRGYTDISTEAEKHQKPYMEGLIYEEGAITVPGDGVSYQGYYYLSSWTKEEEGEWEWVYASNSLALRIALSEVEPLYTLWLHFWTWGPADFTGSRGVKYTFKLDGKPVVERHRDYLDRILSSISISGWKAPSPAPATTPAPEITAAPVTTPAPTPIATPTLDQSQTSTPGNTGLEGDWWLSQSFIPSMPTLTSVEVYVGSVHANLSYPLSVQIRGDGNGLPSDTVLASASVTITKKAWGWITFDLPDLSVNPGTRYHLVLYSVSNYHVGLDSANPYPYGSMGYSTEAGATWKILHDNPNYDMAFKVYGSAPAPPTATPTPKPGGFGCSAPAGGATGSIGGGAVLLFAMPLALGLFNYFRKRRQS